MLHQSVLIIYGVSLGGFQNPYNHIRVIGSVGILVLHTVLLDFHDMVKLSLISDHGCHIHFIMNVIMTPILVSSGWGGWW